METIEIMKQGNGPLTTARILNNRHPDLPKKINHVNVISFRDSLPEGIFKAVQAQRPEDQYIDPAQRLMAELKGLRETIYPKLMAAVEAKDSRMVMALSKTFMATWDRMAKIEEMMNPKADLKSREREIQKEFENIKKQITTAFDQLCPECRVKLLSLTKELSSIEHKSEIPV